MGVHRSGIKMWSDFKLPEEFTWADKGRVQELSRYLIGGKFQELIYRSKKGRKVVDITRIEKIIDLSHDRTLKFIKKLKKHDVLKEIIFSEQTYFILNPKYGLHNRRLHPIAYMVFCKDMKPLLPPYIIMDYARVIEENKYHLRVKIKE